MEPHIRKALRSAREAHRRGEVSRREFIGFAALLGLAVPQAAGLIGPGPAQAARSVEAGILQPRRGGTLRIGLTVRDIDDLSKLSWPEEGMIAGQVVENLARIGPDGICRPWLLKSWSPSSSLTEWTLRLRDDVRWSNGDRLSADDVVASFERWLNTEDRTSAHGLLEPLTETVGGKPRLRRGAVRKRDSLTVELRCAKPFLSLPTALATYTLPVTHRSMRNGQSFTRNPVGTGPFELIEHSKGRRSVLRARTDYWGLGPMVDRCEFVNYGTTKEAIGAFRSGRLDLVPYFDIEDLSAAERAGGEVIATPTASTAVARMKVTTRPFSDVRVRRALQLAMDRDALAGGLYGGHGLVGDDHHVSPVHPEYPDLPAPSRDVDRARRLLAEAGHSRGLRININVNQSTGWHGDFAGMLRSQFREVSVDLRPNNLPGSKFWEVWNTAAFSITSWAQRPGGTDVWDLAYRSGVPWNETGYSNREFDSLLDRADQAFDLVERRRYVADAARILQDDAVILQPIWTPVFSLKSGKLQGLHPNPMRDLFLQDAWIA